MNNTERVHGVMEAVQYDHLIQAIVPGQSLLLSTIIDTLPTPCGRVLELGCGTGIMTGMIRDACPDAEITAIDISCEMMEIASAKPELEGVLFLSRDLREPWPAGEYDAIVSSLCLHHVSPADRQEVARKASSVLHAGGRFICGDIFRAAEDWEERILTASWVKGMKREGAPDEVIEGMLRQRAGRLPEISTITDFRRSLLAAGFERTWVPFTHGFVGLAAGMMSTHSK